MFCKKCGKYIQPGQNFCPTCGTPVENNNTESMGDTSYQYQQELLTIY